MPYSADRIEPAMFPGVPGVYREALELAVSLRLGRPLCEWLSRAITKRKHRAFSAE